MKIDRFTEYGDLPQWLSVEEVQAYLELGRTAAYDAAKSGKWRVLKAGRLVRVHKSSFAPQDQS
jgi:excisionase family DNA binding protein